MTRIAEIADRLHRLAKRREDEGIYTDAALCEEAAAYLSAALAAEPGEAVQGYCADCECTGPITNGRCRCGSGRIAPLAHPLPLKEEVERVLGAALEFIETSTFNVPTKDYFDAVLKDIDALLSRIRAGATPEPISLSDPSVILAGIKQFGLASDGSDLRDLEAAINRIRAGAQEGWKPIETAPKDGSPFLAFGSYVYEGDTAPTIYMGVAEYSDEPNWPWRDAEGLHRETFYSHWMPLPAAPSPEAKGGRS